MIFITGDTHGTFNMSKLDVFAVGDGKNLTKNDFVIIAGDFGVIWDASETMKEKRTIHEYNCFPFTTLFVDGNHENHDRLDRLPTEEKFGSDVGVVSESIFHLRRGRIYEIDGKKIWTMGGGFSIDKVRRKEFISWWKQELPSMAEMMKGVEVLEDAGKEVDFIVTHASPRAAFEFLNTKKALAFKDVKEELEFQEYLQDVACEVKFKKWFFGHLHIDLEIDKNFTSLYNVVREMK